VSGRDDSRDRIGEKHRGAVGDEDREDHAGPVGDKSVDRGRYAVRPWPAHHSDVRAMHLPHVDDAARIHAERFRGQPPVLGDRLGLVADVPAEIQRSVWRRAYSAMPVGEGEAEASVLEKLHAPSLSDQRAITNPSLHRTIR
jgi:hypothetical protein